MPSSPNLQDGSYASAVILYGMNQPYSIYDTSAVLVGAASAVLNGATNLVVIGPNALATDLLKIDSLTTTVINTSALGTAIGSNAQLLAIYASAGFSYLQYLGLAVTDSAMGADQLLQLKALTNGMLDIGGVKQITGSADAIGQIHLYGMFAGKGNAVFTLNDQALQASTLVQLDGMTSQVVQADSVTAINGFLSEIQAVYGAAKAGAITGLGKETLSLYDAALQATDILDLQAQTGAVIDGSGISKITGSSAQLLAVVLNTPWFINPGMLFLDVSDSSANAADLLQLVKQTGNSVGLGNVQDITGTAAELDALHWADEGFSAMACQHYHLSEQSADATVVLQVLQWLGANMGASLAVDSLHALTGNAIDMINVLGAFNITGLGMQTDLPNDPVLPVSLLMMLRSMPHAMIDLSQVGTVSGSANDLLGFLLQSAGATDLPGLNSRPLTLNGDALYADILDQLATHTSATIQAGGAAYLTGSTSDIINSFTFSTIVGLGQLMIMPTESSQSAANLLALNALTSAPVSAANANLLSGSAADISAAYAAGTSGAITGMEHKYLLVIDASVPATTISALDALTDRFVDLTNVGTITGSLAAVQGLFDAQAAGSMAGLFNQQITLKDSSATASQLIKLDGETSGMINAASLTKISGSASELHQLYYSAGFSGLGNEALALTDVSVAATALTDIDGFTTGAVNAASITSLTGTAASVLSLYTNSAQTVANLGNEAVIISDTGLQGSVLKAIDGATTGVINASSVTSFAGTAADMLAIYSSTGISGLGNESVMLSDKTLVAATASAIDALDAGTINLQSVLTVTGSIGELLALYTVGANSNSAGQVYGLGNETANVIGDATITQLKSLDALDGGLVKFSTAVATTSADTFSVNGFGFTAPTTSTTVTYTAGNQAGSAWFTNVAGAGLFNGDTFTINGAMDVIGFVDGARLNLAAFNLFGQSSPAQFGATGSKVGDGEYELVRGNLAGNVFTDSSAGNALLVVWDGNPNAGSVTQVAVVLTGVTALTIGTELMLA